jgi:hypothetical protein
MPPLYNIKMQLYKSWWGRGGEGSRFSTYYSINKCLQRNQQLNRVTLLLVSLPPRRPQQRQYYYHATTTMMLKTWHMAITKFATVTNNSGASAIFQTFHGTATAVGKTNQATGLFYPCACLCCCCFCCCCCCCFCCCCFCCCCCCLYYYCCCRRRCFTDVQHQQKQQLDDSSIVNVIGHQPCC